MKCFGLRGGQIHRNLKAAQYSIKYSFNSEVDVLTYQEWLDKTCQAGLRNSKVMPRTGEVLAQPHNERCVVNLFRKYLSKIPQTVLFTIMRVSRKEIQTS